MSEGPIQAYRQLIKNGDIAHDDAQELAVEKLQILHSRLERYEPAKPQKRGWWPLMKKERHAEPPQGLYIYGDVGRGKSMLMDLFYETVPFKAKRRVHFHAFMQEVHSRLKEARKSLKSGDVNDAISPLAEDIAADAWLLCFDEMQVTDIADAMLLGRLFTSLMEHGVVLVATSNRHPDDLYKGGINRQLFLPAIDLIKSKLDLLHLDSPTDYRFEYLEQHDVFFTPIGPESDRELAEAFRVLSNGVVGQEVTLTVNGRRLVVPKAADSVAFMTFEELCDRPLGPADYLALAERFRVLIVKDVPIMTQKERNAAKRFTTLIDALYEQKSAFICSADGPAESLYPAGDGAFEFHRTVSRIVEMQSVDYLAEVGHALSG